MGKYVNVQKQQYVMKGLTDVKTECFPRFDKPSFQTFARTSNSLFFVKFNDINRAWKGKKTVQNLKSDKDVVKPT